MREETSTAAACADITVATHTHTQEETWTAADAETMELPDSAERPNLDDPFAKLEHGNEDSRRGRESRTRLTELYTDSSAKFKDDYAANKALRRAMRCVL